MRGIVKHFVINIVTLYLVTQWFSGLTIANGTVGLIVAGVGLTLANFLARPIINLLLLPINLITFGLFRWVASIFTLYIVTLVVPGFAIANFHFGGLSTQWVDLPSANFAGFMALVAFSFIISLFSSLIHWVVK